MMHRLLQFPSEWEWHMLHAKRPASAGPGRSRKAAASDAAERREAGNQPKDGHAGEREDAELSFKQDYPDYAVWLQEAEGCAHNQIAVTDLADGRSVLQGTLMFQASDDEEDIHPLHFRVTKDRLVTYQSDMRLSLRLQLDPWHAKLQRCQSAPEALFVILSNLLETFHAGLDRFERRLGELERKMSSHNKTGLMNTIFKRRYELLHWSHLFIPIKEIQSAAKEAFLDELADAEIFKRMELRLDRVQGLLSHYAMEIDTLLMMDDAISNFRGNDIMKTLTIFTALFMPATVIGAVWGMNFRSIPWAGERWGFITVSAVIVVTTLLIYWWLWRKGWTGDLLVGRKQGEIVGAPNNGLLESVTPKERLNDDVILPPRGKSSSRAMPPIVLNEILVGTPSESAPGANRNKDDGEDAPLPSRSSR